MFLDDSLAITLLFIFIGVMDETGVRGFGMGEVVGVHLFFERLYLSVMYEEVAPGLLVLPCPFFGIRYLLFYWF